MSISSAEPGRAEPTKKPGGRPARRPGQLLVVGEVIEDNESGRGKASVQEGANSPTSCPLTRPFMKTIPHVQVPSQEQVRPRS